MMDWKPPDVDTPVKVYLGAALPNTHFKVSRTLTWAPLLLIYVPAPRAEKESTTWMELQSAIRLIVQLWPITPLRFHKHKNFYNKTQHLFIWYRILPLAVVYARFFRGRQRALVMANCIVQYMTGGWGSKFLLPPHRRSAYTFEHDIWYSL